MLSKKTVASIADELWWYFEVRDEFWGDPAGLGLTYSQLIAQLENQLAYLYGRYVGDSMAFRKALDSTVFTTVGDYYSLVEPNRSTIERDYINCRKLVGDIVGLILTDLGTPKI